MLVRISVFEYILVLNTKHKENLVYLGLVIHQTKENITYGNYGIMFPSIFVTKLKKNKFLGFSKQLIFVFLSF